MRRQQALAQRVLWGAEQRIYIALFNEATVLHDRYVIRQPRHNAHVMGHQQQPQTAAGDDIRQQIQNDVAAGTEQGHADDGGIVQGGDRAGNVAADGCLIS